MARKKQEIQLQVEVETQEEWEEMLSKEGLTIVDIYQEWCGPCKALVANFRRLKNELGDDLLRFGVAKADTVDALERYRGRCQPCFLFFAGGSLVHVIRGCNAPQLIKCITEQLAQEHKVLEGNAERKEINDPQLGQLSEHDRDDDEDEDEDEKVDDDVDDDVHVDDEEAAARTDEAAVSPVSGAGPHQSPTPDGFSYKGEKIIFESLPEFVVEEEDKEVKKAVTVAILKPDIVEEGKAGEVIQKMKEAGIEILEQQERTLTKEEAREFYAHKKDEEFFEDLIKHMTSGPSHVLILTKGERGEGIIDDWRELIGPTVVEEAKEQAPNSLRAQYGKENYVNALHGSDSTDTAMRELAFFFPEYGVPTVTVRTKKPKIQRTIALIRPDALRERKDEILEKIKEAGFEVAMQREISLTKEQAEDFYKEHIGEEYFEELTNRMSSGPMLALALAREDAVHAWRSQLGPQDVNQAKESEPDSFRAQFSVEGVPLNQLHGSDSETSAEKEINYFFPMQQTVACIKPDAYQTRDEIMQRIREAGFHIAARKETSLTEEVAKQFYEEQDGKEYYEDLVNHMTSGPTLFMVLSRENAVEGWRSLLGPTDPGQAKDAAPDTLRALYGKDIKENAVHGSSDEKQAAKNIKVIFGDLEFATDGTVLTATPQQTQEDDTEKQQTEDDKGGEDDQGGEKEPEARPPSTNEKKDDDNGEEKQDDETQQDGDASSKKADDEDDGTKKGENDMVEGDEEKKEGDEEKKEDDSSEKKDDATEDDKKEDDEGEKKDNDGAEKDEDAKSEKKEDDSGEGKATTEETGEDSGEKKTEDDSGESKKDEDDKAESTSQKGEDASQKGEDAGDDKTSQKGEDSSASKKGDDDDKKDDKADNEDSGEKKSDDETKAE